MSAITKADTVALWHAVESYALQVRLMRDMDFTPEVLAAERDRAVRARRALRKVNAIRKAAAPPTGGKRRIPSLGGTHQEPIN